MARVAEPVAERVLRLRPDGSYVELPNLELPEGTDVYAHLGPLVSWSTSCGVRIPRGPDVETADVLYDLMRCLLCLRFSLAAVVPPGGSAPVATRGFRGRRRSRRRFDAIPSEAPSAGHGAMRS